MVVLLVSTLFNRINNILKNNQLPPGLWRNKNSQGTKSKACVFFHAYGNCNKQNNCQYSHICKCNQAHPLIQHKTSNNNGNNSNNNNIN